MNVVSITIKLTNTHTVHSNKYLIVIGNIKIIRPITIENIPTSFDSFFLLPLNSVSLYPAIKFLFCFLQINNPLIIK